MSKLGEQWPIELYGKGGEIVPHMKIVMRECMDGTNNSCSYIDSIVVHDLGDGYGWRVCEVTPNDTYQQTLAKLMILDKQRWLRKAYERLRAEQILLEEE